MTREVDLESAKIPGDVRSLTMPKGEISFMEPRMGLQKVRQTQQTE
jgi:hypothetical protein